MNATTRLAAYGFGLAAVFATSFAVGGAVGPVGLSNAEPPAEHGGMSDGGSGLPGLASTAEELTIVPTTDTLPAGREAQYSFTIVGDGGRVTEFDLEHTKRMHLIVVRRDLVGFVHEHPTMAPDGTWSTPLELTEPGVYRVYADFVVDGDKHTLGTDLFVPGDFQPVPLPDTRALADAGDGYEVEISGEVVAGEESTIEFTVRHDGQVVGALPDHLGAKGHLVALRDGDLAYLHVHADEERLEFAADFPSAGSYRLFLQFRGGDAVRTAEFTLHVREGHVREGHVREGDVGDGDVQEAAP